MASLREFRKKIKSVKSTEQITKAMKMVAAARLRRAQSRILNARPFAEKMQEMIQELSASLTQADTADVTRISPLLSAQGKGKVAIVLVTADKGLCGAFNTTLIRKAAEVITQNSSREVLFFAVGRKGRDFFRRSGYPLYKEYINLFNKLTYTHAEILGRDLMAAFIEEKCEEVIVIYNAFKSVIAQNLVTQTLLPLDSLAPQTAEESAFDFLYEPNKPQLLQGLLPRYFKGQIYRILLESAAAELGARMAAMDAATKNAKELISALTLSLNRTRQAMITKEISELVGGAEALK